MMTLVLRYNLEYFKVWHLHKMLNILEFFKIQKKMVNVTFYAWNQESLYGNQALSLQAH